MAYYDFMTKPFAICIEAGYTKIDEVFPDDLKQKVIAFLANKGLGPDGKPLPVEEPEKPDEEVEEAKDVNYVINLEDEITDFFREKLIAAFNTNEE